MVTRRDRLITMQPFIHRGWNRNTLSLTISSGLRRLSITVKSREGIGMQGLPHPAARANGNHAMYAGCSVSYGLDNEAGVTNATHGVGLELRWPVWRNILTVLTGPCFVTKNFISGTTHCLSEGRWKSGLLSPIEFRHASKRLRSFFFKLILVKGWWCER